MTRHQSGSRGAIMRHLWGELTVVASVIAGLWGLFFWLSR